MNTEVPPQRLPLVDPDAAPEEVATVFHELPPINLFRAMANARSLFPAYMDYLALLFKPLELDAAVERMVVLYVAQQSDCFYAFQQNVVVAKSVHVSQEQIEALERGDTTATCFTDAQKSAFRFTEETMRLIEVRDETYAQVQRYFSARAITEMLYVIGTYMFVARLARTGRVPLDKEPAFTPKPQ